MTIKAIETRYNGYRFRSRLEARWAVFFDTLGIKYEYEKEGFNLDGLCYLPDFYIPHLDTFIEIKGAEPTEDDCDPIRSLSVALNKNVYLFYGQCWMRTDENEGRLFEPSYSKGEIFKAGIPKQDWIECVACNEVVISTIGARRYLPCDCLPQSVSVYNIVESEEGLREVITTGDLLLQPSNRIVSAFMAAREARFEFGETPTAESN